MQVAVFAPAKINLFLAITGRRPDGFHSLVSLVSPLAWGDTLWVEESEATESIRHAHDEMVCNDGTIPTDGTNLVLRAASSFRAATGWSTAVRFRLVKRTPHGAGLGGGSSDAVATLRALNLLAGRPMEETRLAALSAAIGSDCPLFFAGGPVIMRGRGEDVQPLLPEASLRLRGQRVLLFKPSFGIATAWSYARLAAEAPDSYLDAECAEAKLSAWFENPQASPEQLLFNSMEAPAFEKYLALPSLLGLLRSEFGVNPMMSGSGSACFCFLPEHMPAAPLETAIRDAWGPGAFVLETRLG